MNSTLIQPELSEIFVPPPILDANGQPLRQGSIVGMSDPHGHFQDYRGVVVRPYTRFGDHTPEYSVAVFFNTEVADYQFDYSPHYPERAQWDLTYKEQMREGSIDFLDVDDLWQRCFRIHYFRPDELVVRDRFKIEHLAKRVVKSWWVLYALSPEYPEDPELYLCVMEGCPEAASRIAFLNVWGNVYACITCTRCFQKYNGLRGDGLPPRKNKILLRDGTPARAKFPASA